MKRRLPVFVLFCVLCVSSIVCSAQSMLKFDADGQNHLCSSSNLTPGFHVSSNNLQVYDLGGSTCNLWTVLQLQVNNFTGVGVYSLNYGSGNYGYYNNDTLPPSWSTPDYPDDPGGGTINILQYDSALGILEGTFSMVVSKHMFDTTNFAAVNITSGYFKYGSCSATFNLEHDTVPGHWWLFYYVQGVYPIALSFNWGDGNTTTGNATHTYSAPGNYNICLTITDNTNCVSTYCDSSTYVYKKENIISVDVIDPLATGIQNFEIRNSNFQITPNPATNNVTITIGDDLINSTVTVSDITGRAIAKYEIANAKSEINTTGYENGIYFVTIAGSGDSATKKLVISK